MPYGYYHGEPPIWMRPVYYPEMDIKNPSKDMDIKQIKKIIKFHQELLEEKQNKKKPNEKDKPAPSTFTAVQWMALLMLSSPFLGLAYLKLLTSLAHSLQ